MNFTDILQQVPLWVWLLLAFLLYRGCAALKTRGQTLAQLFLLPACLSGWKVVSLWREAHTFPSSLFLCVGILAGFSVRWKVWRSGSYNSKIGLFERKGSPVTLILIVLVFAFNYAAFVTTALHPEIAAGLLFTILIQGVSVFFCGLFWGSAGWLLAQKYRPGSAR